eukprot:scaffold38735_cov69-Phaeocystis_antarctica.AAC.1
MADLVYQFGRTILGKECSERIFSRVALMEIRPPGFLVRGWSQELNGSARCSGDALIAPTAAQTDGRALPPDRPRWESNPRPPACKSSWGGDRHNG